MKTKQDVARELATPAEGCMCYTVKQGDASHIECLYMDISGLGITETVMEQNQDGEAVSVVKPLQDIAPQMFIYSMARYTKLNKASLIEGRLPINNVLEPVNLFFRAISREDQIAIAYTLFNMHVSICKRFADITKVSELEEFTYNLGDYLITLDNAIGLVDKISNFVSDAVPLGDFEEIGTREQDTEELTFREHDVHGLTVVAIINKMLCPLFSVYMNILLNKKNIICEHGYELPCVFMLSKLLSKHYPELIEKFKNYINHNIKKKNSFIESDAATMLHLTSQTMCLKMYAQLLVRSLVNVDLYNMDRNLMSFVCRSIIDTITSTAKNVNEYPVFVRKPQVKHQDEDTSGYLDVSSAVSKAPFDTSRIIMSAVGSTVEKCLASYAQIFSMDDFRESIAYYRTKTIVPNAFNKFLVNTFFRSFLGGCQCVQLVKSSHFNELVACLQMIALKKGYIELAHMLTAKKSQSTCPENIQFSSSYRSRFYERTRMIFEEGPIGPLAKSFDQWMASIVNEIATHNWYFNTSMPIWDATEQEPLNGDPIPLHNVIEEGCGMILYAQDIENGVYDTNLRSLSMDML